MFAIYGGKQEFTQWDLNQLVTNPCMKEGDEVVFKGFGKAYETTAYSKNGEVVAAVPNFILQKPGTIIVDLGWGLNVRLECRTEFNVLAKEKPADYDCDCNIENRPEKNSGGVSSWNDLQDKPTGMGYIEKGEMTEIPVTGEWTELDEGMYAFVVSEPIGLEIGQTYTVNWDGTEYTCVGQDLAAVNGPEFPGVFLGNAVSVGGEDTGEPFTCQEVGADIAAQMGMYGAIMSIMGSANIPFSIFGEKVTVHELDNRCLDPVGINRLVSPAIEAAKSEAMSEANAALEAHIAKTAIPELDLSGYCSGETWFVVPGEYTIPIDDALVESIINAGVVKVVFPWQVHGEGNSVIAYPIVSPRSSGAFEVCVFLNSIRVNGKNIDGVQLVVVDIAANAVIGTLTAHFRTIALS